MYQIFFTGLCIIGIFYIVSAYQNITAPKKSGNGGYIRDVDDEKLMYVASSLADKRAISFEQLPEYVQIQILKQYGEIL